MMKRFTTWMLAHQKMFYVFVGAVLLSIVGLPLFLNLLDRRQKYEWREYNDFGLLDNKQPFGAKYVDEHLRSMWKSGVVVKSSFSDVLKKHKSKPCNILLLDDAYYYSSEYKDILVEAVNRGCHVLFGITSHYHCRTFNVDCLDNKTFNIDDFKSNGVKKDTIYFSIPNKPQKYLACSIWENMLKTSYFVNMDMDPLVDDYDSDEDVDIDIPDTASVETTPEDDPCYTTVEFEDNGSLDLVRSKDGNSYVLERKIGKGKITFVGIPVLYSNYGMSVPELQKMSDLVMEETFDKSLPLIVIYTDKEEYKDSSSDLEGHDSMFYVLLSHKETALALYLLLLMLVLLLIFNTRRRRNAVLETPLEKNTNIDYIRHISTLYTRNSDYKDLLKIEQRKLLYRLRKEYQFDISTRSFTKPSEYSTLISRAKGLNETEVKEALQTLEEMTSYHGDISRDSYLRCLKLLNRLNKE